METIEDTIKKLGLNVNEEFKITKPSNEDSFLNIRSDNIPKYITYMKEHSIKNISINSLHGYEIKNLDFLKEHSFIEGVFVVDDDIDVSAIHSLPNLKTLILSGDKKIDIDFSCFSNLRVCNISYKFKIKKLSTCKKLEKLFLHKYNPKSKDLTELPELPILEYFELVQSTISSFNGIERFPKLKTLEGYYLKNLETLNELQPISKTLQRLFFDHCKKLTNHGYVKDLQELTWLGLNDCGELPSISFIKKMHKLQKFSFVDTNVTDGDMTPCLNLEFAGFSNKRHFSHKSKQIREMIALQKEQVSK